MNIEDFKRHFYESLEDIKEREEQKERERQEERQQANKQAKEQDKDHLTRERRKQANEVKRILKENYNEPIYTYTIYDIKDNERIVTQFNNINDLLQYIQRYEHATTTKTSLCNMVKQQRLINERYYIVKDKFIKEDFKEDYKQGITYDNKTYIY